MIEIYAFATPIADIAHFGWIWRRAFADVDLEGYPNVKA